MNVEVPASVIAAIGGDPDHAETWLREIMRTPEAVAFVVANNTSGQQSTSKYTARFVPQAWVNNNAVDVDVEGDTEWDVTEAFGALPDDYRTSMIAEIDANGESLDNDDLMKSDERAPKWVREWQGPFSLWVRRQHVVKTQYVNPLRATEKINVKRRFAVVLEDAFEVATPSADDLAEFDGDVVLWAWAKMDDIYAAANDPEDHTTRLLWEDEHICDLDSPDDEIYVETEG